MEVEVGAFFRLNSQISVTATNRGLCFHDDLGEESMRSYVIPWTKVQYFVRWCQHLMLKRLDCQDPFSEHLDKCCEEYDKRKSIKKLSKILGVTSMQIAHWRKGRSLPTEEQVIILANFFGWKEEEVLLELWEQLWQRAVANRWKRQSRGKSRKDSL